MAVTWRHHLWEQPHPAAPHQIDLMERDWGVQLPHLYKQVLVQHQGMRPSPSVFRVGRGSNVFGTLLTVNVEENLEYFSIARSYETIKPYIPDQIFPFAVTPGCDYLCFDFRDSPHQPKVVLVTMEASIYPVANSFEELLEGLQDD